MLTYINITWFNINTIYNGRLRAEGRQRVGVDHHGRGPRLLSAPA